MSRNITDAALIKVTALPAQDSSVDSASIDLGGAEIAALEVIEIQVDLPALDDLADGQTVTLTVEDSADDSTFTAIAGLSTLVATGIATGAGSDAFTRKYKLPSSTRRYIMVSATTSATTGDNTAVSYTWKILT